MARQELFIQIQAFDNGSSSYNVFANKRRVFLNDLSKEELEVIHRALNAASVQVRAKLLDNQ